MPVYQEGDEMVEAAEIGKTAPVVNITTRLASKPSSNTRIDDSKGGSPPLTQLSQQDESADQHLGRGPFGYRGDLSVPLRERNRLSFVKDSRCLSPPLVCR